VQSAKCNTTIILPSSMTVGESLNETTEAIADAKKMTEAATSVGGSDGS